MTNNKVKISVIVPVYNLGTLLSRALDRLAKQTYRDYEVILIDDGSTDGSASICEKYAEEFTHFKTIHKKNGGVSSARNTGLEIANGEWVAFCDPDDLPSTEWLANYNIETDAKAEIIMQGFEADKAAFGPRRNNREVSFDYDGDAVGICQLLLKHNSLGYLWHKLYRLDIIKNNNLRFNSNLRLREDEIFLLEYLPYVNRALSHKKKGYFYFVPEWGFKYGLNFEEECYINDLADKALSILLLSNDGYEYLQNFYIDSRNYNLMVEFDKTHERKYLKQIRQLILKHPDSTRLSPYLKHIIRYDSSMIFSWITLLLHMKLKKTLAK